MFDNLEKAVEHAIRFDTMTDGMFTAFMVNKVKKSTMDTVRDHTENQCGFLLKSFKEDPYANFRNDQRMVKIIEKLIEAGVENGEFYCEDCSGAARNIMYVLEGLKISAQTVGVTAEAVDREFLFILKSLGVED